MSAEDRGSSRDPDEGLPFVTHVEEITLQPYEEISGSPLANQYSLQGSDQRPTRLLERREFTVDTVPEAQLAAPIMSARESVFDLLDEMARRRQEIINRIDRSRHRLQLSRPPSLSFASTFSNSTTTSIPSATQEHFNTALAPPDLSNTIMSRGQESSSGEGWSSTSGRRLESQVSVNPPSLTRQHAFVLPPDFNILTNLRASQQANAFAFLPPQWSTQGLAPRGRSSSPGQANETIEVLFQRDNQVHLPSRQQEFPAEIHRQREELREASQPRSRDPDANDHGHSPQAVPQLPHEPDDERTTDPDAPPTPGRHAPHRGILQQNTSHTLQGPHERGMDATLGAANDENDGRWTVYTNLPSLAEGPPSSSPPSTPRSIEDERDDPTLVIDCLLTHYHTRQYSTTNPPHSPSRSRHTGHHRDRRSPTERNLDARTSHLALMNCFSDSHTELQRLEALLPTPIFTHTHHFHHAHHSERPLPSRRHQPHARSQHASSWVPPSRLLDAHEYQQLCRGLGHRFAHGVATGFRDHLEELYGPVVGRWFWWAWLGARADAETDVEVGWVGSEGGMVLAGSERGGVSGEGVLGAVRWVERDGVGGFEIGTPR